MIDLTSIIVTALIFVGFFFLILLIMGIWQRQEQKRLEKILIKAIEKIEWGENDKSDRNNLK